MLGYVNSSPVHFQCSGNVAGRLFFYHMKIKDLEFGRIGLPLHSFQCSVYQVKLPLLIPQCFEIHALRVGNALNLRGRARVRWVLGRDQDFATKFSKLIGDSSSRHSQEPALE